MALLIVSIVALFVGVAAVPVARRAPVAVAALDGVVLASIAGLLLLHVVPHSLEDAGVAALGLLALGVLTPTLLDRVLGTLEDAGRRGRTGLGVLVVLGVALHALVDGATIGLDAALDAAHHHGHAHDHAAHGDMGLLALSVVLHRLPIGLAVGWWLIPTAGIRGALGAAAGVSVATVAGFALVVQGIEPMHGAGLAMVQAFVAGTLLHILVDRPPALDLSSRTARRAAGVGTLVGIAAVVALLVVGPHGPSHDHGGHEAAALDTLWHLTLESAPALVLAFVGAGLLRSFVSPAAFAWLRRGRPATQAIKGMAFGLPLPICSCGVVPLYRQLSVSGVPSYAALAFLVATPEIGIDAVLISLPLLGGPLTGARLVVSVIAALVVALVVGRLVKPLPASAEGAVAKIEGTTGERIVKGLRFGFTELFDDVAPWIGFGLVIAALIAPVVEPEWFATLPFGVEVLAMALLGMPMYVCASGGTPFIAVLVAAGLSPGAALAFLLTGPATNATSWGVIGGLHGRRVAWAFVVTMVLVAVGCGLAVDAIFTGFVPIDPVQPGHEHHGLLAQASAAVLGLVSIGALVRRGPRGLLAEVFPRRGAGSECDDHGCDDHGCDDHGGNGHGCDDHGCDDHGGNDHGGDEHHGGHHGCDHNRDHGAPTGDSHDHSGDPDRGDLR